MINCQLYSPLLKKYVKHMENQYGDVDNWPQFGCGAKFIPYKYGRSMVVEIQLEDGSEMWVTAHPSYLLRLNGAARDEQVRLFDSDLRAVRQRLEEIAQRA